MKVSKKIKKVKKLHIDPDDYIYKCTNRGLKSRRNFKTIKKNKS